METLRYCKVRQVKSPARAHGTDAGIDFFVPEDLTLEQMQPKFQTAGYMPIVVFNDDKQTIKSFLIEPGQSILIPSGIKMEVPEGYMLMYDNKSGVATKKRLLVGAKIVDIGYQGECHINLHNVSNNLQTISAGDKICQGILVKIGFNMPEEVKSEAELYASASDRGEGGFGSSGVK